MKSLGGKCVFASDIDKNCQIDYGINYGIKVNGDIRKVKEEDIEPFDVLCAGFPCQPFSISGKKMGFLDKVRGTLFFEIIRIVKYHKPKYMLLENVKHLKYHNNGETWKIILDAIKETGYNTYDNPVVFSPHYIGIPQNRERVIIMCVRNDIEKLPNFIFDKTNIPQCTIDSILQDDVDIENIERYKLSKEHIELIEHWGKLMRFVKNDIKCSTILGDGLFDKPNDYDMSIYPKWSHTIRNKCAEFYRSHREFIDKRLLEGKDVKLYKNSRMNLNWLTDKNENNDIWDNLIQIRRSGIRVKKPSIFPTLLVTNEPLIIGKRKRYITPREKARAQSFSEDFILNKSDLIAHKQLGNSVNVEVIKVFAKFMYKGEKTHFFRSGMKAH